MLQKACDTHSTNECVCYLCCCLAQIKLMPEGLNGGYQCTPVDYREDNLWHWLDIQQVRSALFNIPYSFNNTKLALSLNMCPLSCLSLCMLRDVFRSWYTQRRVGLDALAGVSGDVAVIHQVAGVH